MTDERIIAYLLEELPREELERFEEECFTQEDWPAQLNLVEEDLIDDYLRDELAPEQRQRFERNYLTTGARQERVRMAAALLRHVGEYPAAARATLAVPPTRQTRTGRFKAFWSSKTWALRAASSFAMALVIAGVWWLSGPPSPENELALTLTVSNNDRAEGAQASPVKFSRNTSALRISLTLPDRPEPAAGYRVELENDNGETRALGIAEQDTRFVSVVIPASKLASGPYVLKLFAVKTDGEEQRIGRYFFTVE